MTKPTKMMTILSREETKMAPRWSPRNKKKSEELSVENPSNGKSYLSIQKLLICYQKIDSDNDQTTHFAQSFNHLR